MTKQEILAMTGLSEPEFYAQYPTQEAFQMAMGGMVDEYKKGGWIQKATASIKRRGTEGVCTGSNFGGPSCRPGTKRYALAKTFRKMAKSRKKEDGGMVDMYEDGEDPPYTSRDRAQDSTLYADINIPFNMRKILLGDTFGSYEEIGSAEDYGSDPSVEEMIAHMRDPRASGYSHARQAAINAFRNKGAAGKLYLTNDEVAKIAKRFQDVDKEGKYTTPNNPMYGSNSYDLKATLSAPDYWRVMQEIKRNKSKKANGGVVDAYQLMGMPTPEMYGMGGYAPIGMYSHVMSRQNLPNMGMAYGGQVPMYKLGSVLKDIGAGAYGAGEGLLDTVTFGATDQLTDQGYKGLQKLGGSSESEIRQQDSIRGYGMTAGAITGGILNPAAAPAAIQQGSKGLGMGISKGSPDSKLAQGIGTYLPMAGNIAGMAAGQGAFGNIGGGAAGMAQSADFAKSGFGQFAQNAGQVGQGYNAMQSGNPMAMFGMFGGGYAMGGQVNYPEGLQMGDGSYVPMMNRPTTDRMLSNRTANRIPTFAMGGSTGNTIDINVEKGELLIDPKTGKILTEYRGGGMVPHPEEGIDERGTVSAQEGKFIIPKKYAERYKKADKLGRQSIEQRTIVEKAKKEAKEQQLAMLEEQKAAKAMNRMVAKYGGAIQRMYANGGNVMKYALGDYVDGEPDSLGNFPSAIANILSGVQPNPFLQRFNNATQTVATPLNQAQQSQVGTGLTVPGYGLPELTIQGQAPQGVTMGAGLLQSIQQPNQPQTFRTVNYPQGYQPPQFQANQQATQPPNQQATRQPWSLQRTMQGIQPNPFLQRVMQGVPPSRTFQNIVNPSGSVVTSPNTTSTPRPATPSVNRPAYVAPGTTRATPPTPPTRRIATPTSTPTPSVSSFLSGYTPYYAPDNEGMPPNTNPFPSEWWFTEQDIPRLEAIEKGYPIQNVDRSGAPVYDLADLPEPQAAKTVGAPSYGTPSYTPSPAMQGTEGFKSPGASGAGSAGYTPSPSAIQGSANAGGGAGMGTSQMDKYLMAAQFLPAAYNIGRGLFEKAWQPGSYETPADLKWQDMTGEAGRRDMLRAYNLAKYNARQIGGSGALAALQSGSTGYQQNLAAYNEALENKNKLGRLEADRFNKAIQQANMQMRMQRDYLAQQAREQKAAMVGKGIEGIGQGAGQLWQNKQMMDALRMAYPQNTYTPGTTPSTTSSGSITPSMPFTGGERMMFDTSRPSVRQIRSWNSYKG